MFEIDRGAQPIISPTAARTRRRWAIPRLEPPFHTTDVIKRGHVVGDLGDCHPNIGGPIGKTPCATSSDARRNVDDTFETLNEQVLEDVARCLSHVDTTLVVAAGATHGAGSYLASSLQIIGVRTVLVTGVADAAPALATLGSGDVVVGLGLWRYRPSRSSRTRSRTPEQQPSC